MLCSRAHRVALSNRFLGRRVAVEAAASKATLTMLRCDVQDLVGTALVVVDVDVVVCCRSTIAATTSLCLCLCLCCCYDYDYDYACECDYDNDY